MYLVPQASVQQAENRANSALSGSAPSVLGIPDARNSSGEILVRRSILLLGASPSSQATFAGQESVLFLFAIILVGRARPVLAGAFDCGVPPFAGGPPTARARPVAGRRAPRLHPNRPSANPRSLALHVYKWFSFQSRRSKLGAPRGMVVRLEKARKRGQATEAGLPPTRTDAGLGNEGGYGGGGRRKRACP